MTDPRPQQPTVAQMREICQPPEIRLRPAEHWTADLYQRKLSPYLTRVLVRLGFSANGVTWLMIVTGILAGVALLIPSLPGAILAVLLGQLQMLWDCCDGEVARWRQTSSAAGIFLDAVGHYAAEASICIALGFRATGSPSTWSTPSWYMVCGGILAVLILFNRGLNEMAISARYRAALPKVADAVNVAVPNSTGVAKLRSAARVVPLHRVLHSVELTLLIFVAACIDAGAGSLIATRVLLVLLIPGTLLVLAGHLIAILSSDRLK